MPKARLLFGVIGATLIIIGARAVAQSELPEGPNRDVVARECQVCHGLHLITAGRTREQWSALLTDMESNGLNVSSDDRQKIFEYLATYLVPRSSEPVTVLRGNR